MKKIWPKCRTIPYENGVDQKGKLLFAVNSVAKMLLTADKEGFENSIRDAMAMVAHCLDIDRIYIWQNRMNNGSLEYVQHFEWPGSFKSPGKTVCSKTSFAYSESIPEWEEKFLNGECVNGPLCNLSRIERERLEPYGIRSILAVPVHLQGLFWGFVSFDDCRRERTFTETEESILRSSSLLIANALLRNEMNHDLYVAVEQSKAASKAKSEFMAQMSHELRTPMNVISGMTEIMLRKDVPSNIHEHILAIKRASDSMISLINDVLDFSAIGPDSSVTAPADCSLTSFVNETLLNVLKNSERYIAEGFISLAVTREGNRDTIVSSVEALNGGTDVAEGDMSKLSDNIIRLDSKKNTLAQGSEIELPASRSILNAMDGNTSARGGYGGGSTFTVTFPLRTGSRDEKSSFASDPGTKRVLLYEPRQVYADSIARALDKLNVRCTLVKNHREFYDELKRQTYPLIFVSSRLSESAGRIVEALKLKATLVLLMEFGESPSMSNVRTIVMPVHTASIASVLEDIEDNTFRNVSAPEALSFIAPSVEILIVDDMEINLMVAQELMLPYKMQIDVCESGEDAIEYVMKKRYDIIFMDHMMPGIDGLEATSRIRSLKDRCGYYRNVPIIALTANTVPGAREMFLQNGMSDFLAKPIDVAKLHGLLEKWVPDEKKLKLTKKNGF